MEKQNFNKKTKQTNIDALFVRLFFAICALFTFVHELNSVESVISRID